MTVIEHQVRLRSDQKFGRKAPPEAIGEVMRQLPGIVGQSILMAVEGRSRTRGRRPDWLRRAADIRFVDYSGRDDTILHFEATPLGEAAPILYQQQEFWDTKPDPGDTGFDLFGDVVTEVKKENTDSNRFDSGLLRRLRKFDHALSGTFSDLRILGHRYSAKKPAVVNHDLIEVACRLVDRTPSPNRVRIVGTLDMIRASTEAFAIKLDDGHEVRGVLEEGEIDSLADLFHRRVLVLGKAVYRPSGSLLRIDALQVSDTDDVSSLWSKLPAPPSKKLDVASLRKPQGAKSGVAAIIGKWPGSETDEQISAALAELS